MMSNELQIILRPLNTETDLKKEEQGAERKTDQSLLIIEEKKLDERSSISDDEYSDVESEFYESDFETFDDTLITLESSSFVKNFFLKVQDVGKIITSYLEIDDIKNLYATSKAMRLKMPKEAKITYVSLKEIINSTPEHKPKMLRLTKKELNTLYQEIHYNENVDKYTQLFKEIEYLDLSGNGEYYDGLPDGDLNWMPKFFPNLTHINLSNQNRMTDLSMLSEFEKLTHINISKCSSLKVLWTNCLPNLRYLNMANAKDVKGLQFKYPIQISKLEYLNVSGLRLKERHLQEIKPKHQMRVKY